jgi:hypothetical protein
MEMSGQLNVPAALPPQKEPVAPIGCEAQWPAVSLSAVGKRKFSNPWQELNVDSSSHPAHTLVLIPTQLSWLLATFQIYIIILRVYDYKPAEFLTYAGLWWRIFMMSVYTCMWWFSSSYRYLLVHIGFSYTFVLKFDLCVCVCVRACMCEINK